VFFSEALAAGGDHQACRQALVKRVSPAY
jgi:hypothetical protein